MKWPLILPMLATGVAFGSTPQPAPQLIQDSSAWNLQWWGVAGRTYFIQVSDDLVNWNYADVIEVGNDEPIEYEIGSTGTRVFVRLEYTDDSSPDPDLGDFDHDGLTNREEIELGTDPLNADTNGNGLSDGWEAGFGVDPVGSGSGSIPVGGTGDSDGDEITDAEEYAAGTNPKDSADFPLQIISVSCTTSVTFDADSSSGGIYSVPNWTGTPNQSDISSPVDIETAAKRQAFPNSPDVGRAHYDSISLDGSFSSFDSGFTGGQNGSASIDSMTSRRVWVKTKAAAAARSLPFLKVVTKESTDSETEETQTTQTAAEIDAEIPANSTLSAPIDIYPTPEGSSDSNVTKVQLLSLAIVSGGGRQVIPGDGVCIPVGQNYTFDIPGLGYDQQDLGYTITWQRRKVSWTGSPGSWFTFHTGAAGEHHTGTLVSDDPGIYQIQAIVSVPSATNPIPVPFLRLNDAPYGAKSSGEFQEKIRALTPDYFGVTSTLDQVVLRNTALPSLGSKAFAKAVALTCASESYPSGATKCNAFVYIKAREAGQLIPFIRQTPVSSLHPPRARDWWDPSLFLDGWPVMTQTGNWPEPGMVIAGLEENSTTEGHVGIVDYDGSWIQAGGSTVNKYPQLNSTEAPYINATFRLYEPTSP